MKTIPAIKQEIEAITANVLSMKESAFRQKKVGKRCKFLRECISYLETDPKEEFVRKMLSDSLRRLEIIDEGFDVWVETTPEAIRLDSFAKKQKMYDKWMDRESVEFQIKTLKYLLS